MGHFMETGKWVVEKDYAYACSVYHSGLLRINFSNNTVDYIGKLIDVAEAELLYDNCYKWKEKVWCLPSYTARNICIYDLDNNTYKQVIVEDQNEGNGLKVLQYEVIGSVLYFASPETDTVYGFDLDLEEVVLKVKAPSEYSISKNILYHDNKLFVLCRGVGLILQIDLYTQGVSIISAPVNDDSMGIMLQCKDMIWFAGEKKQIYVWEPLQNKYTILDFPANYVFREYKDDSSRYIFSEAVCVGESCWFISYQSKQLLYADGNNKKLKSFDLSENILGLRTKGEGAWGIDYRVIYVREDRYIGLFVLSDGIVVEIDTEQLEAYRRSFVMGDTIKRMYQGALFHENNKLEKALFWSMIIDT